MGGIVARIADPASRTSGPDGSGRTPLRTAYRFLNRLRVSTLNQRALAYGTDEPERFYPPSLRPGAPIGQAPPVFPFPSSSADAPVSRGAGRCVRIGRMELTWYGRTCVRLRGKDAVVVTDPFQSVVGPTGRGITGDIVTFSHPDDSPLPRAKGKTSRDGKTLLPSSLDDAFVLDGPGEYEVKEVLVTGVRTYRDDARGAEGGKQVSFVVEVDGVHTIHLGDIGHLLSEEKLGDIGVGRHRLRAARWDADRRARPRRSWPSWTREIVVPMPICEDEADCAEALSAVLPRDGRRAGHPAEAVGDGDEPARARRRRSCWNRAASRSDPPAATCRPRVDPRRPGRA